MKIRFAVAALGLSACLFVGITSAQQAGPSADNYQFTPVNQTFTRPVQVVNAGDGSNWLFVVQQGGRIELLIDGEKQAAPFLDLTSLVSRDANTIAYTERGLLGLAFAPDYQDSGRLYVNYTDANGNSVVARYRVSADNPAVADPASAEIILTQQQPYSNHNGGSLAFGPDGYLYIGFGDGGSQGDPQGNAQNLSTWLGKILRVDVSGDGEGFTVPVDNPFAGQADALPEIWAYGLRNPWRMSFDALTGDLYFGDVGGSRYEEINFQPADSTGGENYGWNTMEGFAPTGLRNPPDGLTPPIAVYDHNQGISVSGGYVYRGEQLPELDGTYFYGDWGTGTIWTAWRDGETWTSGRFMPFTGFAISSFGVDEQGELLLVDYNGGIYRLTVR
jgi:glucose/arabinose dehydrogenase